MGFEVVEECLFLYTILCYTDCSVTHLVKGYVYATRQVNGEISGWCFLNESKLCVIYPRAEASEIGLIK